MSDKLRFAALARSFHAIRYVDRRLGVWVRVDDPGSDLHGVELVDLLALDRYGAEYAPDLDEGCVQAAAFLLNLWSTYEKWKTGPFDLFKAMAAWDEQHRIAFTAWVCDPWRP